MAEMTLEAFDELCERAGDGVNRKRLAKLLNVELPKEPIAPLAEQLGNVGITEYTPKVTKTRPNPSPRDYVSVPSLKIDEDTSTKPFMVNATVARAVAERIIAVCDSEGL